MKKKSGFTLMEMLITIFIVLTILGFAAPATLQMVATYSLHSAAREVAADMWNTRLLAVNQNQSFQISFDGNSYQIIRVSDNSVVKTVSLATYNAQASTGAIIFSSRGIPQSAASITLTNGQKSKTVNVTVLGRAIIS